MLELNKFKTNRTQLNESEVRELKFIQSNLEGAICILTYIKPKFKIWGLNHYLGWIRSFPLIKN